MALIPRLPALCFLLAFVGVAVGLERATPTDLPVISAKQAYLRQDIAGYSVIFLGTSRTWRHVIPALFDAEVLRRTGQVVRSFNFGVSALTVAEADLIAARWGEIAPPRWVVVETELFSGAFGEETGTRRDVAWHTPTEAALACMYSVHAPPPGLGPCWIHLEALASHLFFNGRAAEALRRAWGADPSPDSRTAETDLGYAVEDAGYRALERESGPGAPPRASADRLLQVQLQALRSGPAPVSDPWRNRMYGRIVASVRRIGAAPVLLQVPAALAHGVPVLEGEVAPPVLDLRDPARHADLYDPALYFDANHLNEEGARHFTRALAQEFAAQILAAPTTDAVH